MIKFGEVQSFVDAVALMREKQKWASVHKDYNSLADVRYRESIVDEMLATLKRNVARTLKEKQKKAQPTLC